ncbi:DUF2059 domain-containing protein [Pseudomonas sp. SA3-5]|uniref:DUF2059 domain-containing protein n=1 Tax=Pseudomonas aestuarii TaxID=3018340 RepID=A0ABT4XJG4_9PSED|nr:DUF2059 domain-containing protein [Pseudomonas aestuarii]MDA7088342.1 DUF2059 domain-containing protein [Pseudomonas aestuarii]
MSRLSALCAVAVLTCASAQVFADASSHAAEAERFLQLARADKLAVPVYAQVQQMFAQRFAESGAGKGKQALLESYQAKANVELDQAVSWDQLKPEMVKLYTSNFNEQELQDLISFYQSPVGQKVLQKMPMLTAQAAQLTQGKLQVAVPKVNKLLAEMSAELEPKKP